MTRAVLRIAVVLAVVALLATAAAATYVWRSWQRLHRPFPEGGEHPTVVVDIAPGLSVTTILELLEHEDVVVDATLARLYLTHYRGDPALQAGEYRFERPLTTPEALEQLIAGRVLQHPVTVIEGQTLEETAELLVSEGLGEHQAFLRAMSDPTLIADLDPQAEDLEGYLFPDTYHFPKGVSETEVVTTLVRTFRQLFERKLSPLLEPGDDFRSLVVLASIVEKEARLDHERAVIAGVYANRLRIGMGLYADPTVIFALKRQGTWDGNLRRNDLQLDSPYNTYRYPGLPPGPICSPGAASLLAAAAPAEVSHLYFVSRNDGSHVFADTLAEHNRNVNRWQRQYWRQRWSKEPKGQ